jgi:vancomycin resistance protein YoaR
VPFISKKTAATFLTDITEAVKKPSKNATWTTDGDKAYVVPSVNATTLDVDKTLSNLNAAALKTTGRAAQVVLKEVPAERTTEQAKAMGIEVPLGSFTTDNHGDNNRMRNVIVATAYANNTLLAPGQEFDYNVVVNSHTVEPGVFFPAPAIQPDGGLKDEIGGGICQVSTTLFNAVFFAGLEVLERYNHTNYISSYPLGRDAAVNYGGGSFRFRNDTNYWILIKGYADEAECTFVIYGTDEGRKVTYTTSDWYGTVPMPAEQKVKDPTLFVGETKVKAPGQPGKSVKVVRSVTLNGEEIHRDVFVSEFPARPKITLEGTKPKEGTTTTTTKSGTTTTTTVKPSTTTTTHPATTTTKPPTTTTTKPPTTTTSAG